MEKIKIKVICFAGLRKYLGSETFVFVESATTYSKVINELILLKPEAKEILTSSRIAVNEEFVSLNEKLKSVDTIFLIPPSSGG
jgi:sulfur-carrier protein